MLSKRMDGAPAGDRTATQFAARNPGGFSEMRRWRTGVRGMYAGQDASASGCGAAPNRPAVFDARLAAPGKGFDTPRGSEWRLIETAFYLRVPVVKHWPCAVDFRRIVHGCAIRFFC